MTRPPAPPLEESSGKERDRAERIRVLAQGLQVDRPIVLIGMPGAGKTTMGRRLAAALRLPFKDADHEIQNAAGRTIPQIFEELGEPEFRRGEQRVIARLVQGGQPLVLATGGGAFMNADTRALLAGAALTIWLRADLELLLRRVEKKDNRPLLRNGDQRATLERLMRDRHPQYAEADIVIDMGGGPQAAGLEAVLRAVAAYFDRQRAGA
ncbi:MAG: shikimate kinase [Hyphomonadaceae bacterium]